MTACYAAAQHRTLPDTVPMHEARFAATAEGGAAMQQAWDAHLSGNPAAPAHAKTAIAVGERLGDFYPQVIGQLVLASRDYEAGNFKEAFRGYHDALLFDTLMDPLSPVRQLLHKEVGTHYNSFGAKRMALKHITKMVQIGEERDSFPTERQFRAYSDLAGFLQDVGQTDSALAMYRKALAHAKTLGRPLYHSSGHNNLGMAFFGQGHLDSAAYHYAAALVALHRMERLDSHFLGSIQDNVAQLELQQGNCPAALARFESNVRIYKGLWDYYRYLNALVSAANASMRCGDPARTRALLQAAEAYMPTTNKDTRTRMQPRLLRAKIAYYGMQNALKDQIAAMKALQALTDSLLRDAEISKIEAMEELMESRTNELTALAVQHRLENERMGRELNTTRNYILLAILSGILLLILAALYYRTKVDHQAWRRKTAELELAKEQAEKERLNHELGLKDRDVTDMALGISIRRNLMAEWLDELKQVATSPHPAQALQAHIQQVRAQLQQGDLMRMQPGYAGQVSHGFVEKLRALAPDITRAEIELCEMVRLRLTTKEIANRRSITPHAVRMAKYRLKKKFNLEEELDLFLQRL